MTLLATALCADRAVAAAPVCLSRPQLAGVAGRLVTRLTNRLQRVVPGVRLYQPRDQRIELACPHAWTQTETLGFRRGLSPAQFCLPPPARN